MEDSPPEEEPLLSMKIKRKKSIEGISIIEEESQLILRIISQQVSILFSSDFIFCSNLKKILKCWG
jgi:hypothetical protein